MKVKNSLYREQLFPYTTFLFVQFNCSCFFLSHLICLHCFCFYLDTANQFEDVCNQIMIHTRLLERQRVSIIHIMNIILRSNERMKNTTNTRNLYTSRAIWWIVVKNVAYRCCFHFLCLLFLFYFFFLF